MVKQTTVGITSNKHVDMNKATQQLEWNQPKNVLFLFRQQHHRERIIRNHHAIPENHCFVSKLCQVHVLWFRDSSPWVCAGMGQATKTKNILYNSSNSVQKWGLRQRMSCSTGIPFLGKSTS